MKLVTVFVACARSCAAAPNGDTKIEMGDINGAKFRIDVPKNWNGGERAAAADERISRGTTSLGCNDYRHAAELLTKAAEAEDALNYDEPPDWYIPPRESLGAVLFADGRTGEAESVFRAELKAHAKNPRALFGLSECLAAQHRTEEAATVRKEFEDGWKYSDIKLRMADL